jgi:hypothetical protein
MISASSRVILSSDSHGTISEKPFNRGVSLTMVEDGLDRTLVGVDVGVGIGLEFAFG